MAERTAIGWCHPPGLAPGHTWNPWQGCTHVSTGCKFCYMFREKKRYGQDPSTVIRSKPPTFNAPLKWKEPAAVFTCSWSDFFHPAADEWRHEAWAIIRRTPQLTYLILTKRVHRLPECWPPDWYGGYPNVKLGFSAENQESFDERLRQARIVTNVCSRRFFVSLEPLLAPIVLPDGFDQWIEWVIAGLESGPAARHPADPFRILRSLRDQCTQRSPLSRIRRPVPFYFKQWGGQHHDSGGRELDGRTWDEFPPFRGQRRIAA